MKLLTKCILHYILLLLFCGIFIYGTAVPEGMFDTIELPAVHPVIRFFMVATQSAVALILCIFSITVVVDYWIGVRHIRIDYRQGEYTRRKLKLLKILYWSTFAATSVAIAVIDAVKTNM